MDEARFAAQLHMLIAMKQTVSMIGRAALRFVFMSRSSWIEIAVVVTDGHQPVHGVAGVQGLVLRLPRAVAQAGGGAGCLRPLTLEYKMLIYDVKRQPSNPVFLLPCGMDSSLLSNHLPALCSLCFGGALNTYDDIIAIQLIVNIKKPDIFSRLIYDSRIKNGVMITKRNIIVAIFKIYSIY